MPDIDIDFCQRRRDEVIAHVREVYGSENVSQIATFNLLQARSCIRDVGRVMGMSFAETDRIAKLVPEGIGVTPRGCAARLAPPGRGGRRPTRTWAVSSRSGGGWKVSPGTAACTRPAS